MKSLRIVGTESYLFFYPLPSAPRKLLHKKVVVGLKPGGVFLVESYAQDQLKYGAGGGNSVDEMTSTESLILDLEGLKFSHLVQTERNVVEGSDRKGLGSVVQAIALKEN